MFSNVVRNQRNQMKSKQTTNQIKLSKMESENFDFGIQLLSSQESNLDDNELDNIIIDSKPQTRKSVQTGVV